MAQYTGMILTKKGRDLQAKAEAGATLSLTKVKIGDGQLGQGQSLEDLNDLINPLKTLAISSIQAENGGLCRIRTNITNLGITQGFYVREVGLFATDPDVGEILYAITTATSADYLPPEGGVTVVNNQFDIIVVVGNASTIKATISTSGFVNRDDYIDQIEDVTSYAQYATQTNQTILSGVVTRVVFNKTLKTKPKLFELLPDGSIKVLKNGTFKIEGTTALSPSTAEASKQIAIRVNGSVIKTLNITIPSGFSGTLNCETSVDMVQNDIVDIFAYQNTGSSMDVIASDFLTYVKLKKEV